MAEYLSLLEFLRELVANAGLRDRFAEDPQGALREHGLDHLGPEDVHDALVLAEDNQTADFSLDYTGGHRGIGEAEPLLPGESGHEAAVRHLTTYLSHSAPDTNLDRDVTGDHDTAGSVHDAGEPGTDDSPAFASGGAHDPGPTWTDDDVHETFPYPAEPYLNDPWDDAGEHTDTHPFTDDTTHPDHGLDHLGPIDGH